MRGEEEDEEVNDEPIRHTYLVLFLLRDDSKEVLLR